MKTEALEAAFSVAMPDSALGEFMYMPAGVHRCDLKRGGKPLSVVVKVDATAAPALNEQLEAVNARSPQKAFMDFDHEKKAASFWPKSFAYREQPAPGVYVQGEWTGPGKAALEGKSYRAFSPVFHVDNPLKSSEANPARIICEPEAGLSFGALVNNPAFEQITPLFASRQETAGASSEAVNQHQIENEQMKKTIAELQAAKASLENEVKSLEAKADKSAAESAQLEAKRNGLELAALQIRNAELEASQTKRQVDDAKSAVQRAIKRGAIAPKNTELQASWEKQCTENPTLIGMLDAFEGTSLQAGRTTPNGNSQIVVGNDARGALKHLAEIVSANSKLKLSPSTAAQKGQLAMEAGRFVNREFKKNPDLLDAPIAELLGLEAADYTDPNNNLGTLAGTLVIQRTLQLFKYNFPLLSRVYTDFSDQPGFYNQTETTRIIVVPAVQTYNPALGSDGRPLGWTTTSPAQTTDVSITLNEHVGVPIVLGQDILAATARRLFDEQAEAAQYALGKYFVAKIYKLITPANFTSYAAVTAADSQGVVKVPTAYTTYVVAQKNFARSSLVDIGAAFNQNEVPMDSNRSVLLNSSYFGALAKDPSLVTFFAGQRNPEIITNNTLPTLAGFTPIETPNLPGANNVTGFALHKAAIIAKTRLPQDFTQALGVMVPGSVTTVTDPDTGISVLLVQYVNLTQGYAEWRIEALLGAAVGDKRGGLCITSQ